MIAEDITDLPARTIARTLRNQYPDTVVLVFRGPAENGHVDLVEQAGMRSILKPFTEPSQLIQRRPIFSAARAVVARRATAQSRCKQLGVVMVMVMSRGILDVCRSVSARIEG
jgi:hypothetical protein